MYLNKKTNIDHEFSGQNNNNVDVCDIMYSHKTAVSVVQSIKHDCENDITNHAIVLNIAQLGLIFAYSDDNLS